jgi:EAL domain-containing protein (putative c-di-GMP-specific phosphodiesterase class I)
MVMPDEFVPLAERSGLIGDLTNAVLAAALKQMRIWNDQGLRLSCAVNLPPTLVTDLSFPDRVAALLAEYQLDGSQLALEITETATMQNPTITMDILTRLRVKRIGLSLDDFGTGYSSLTQLYQMPFNEMKIDKSLVINEPHSREANTMVGSLVELGHNLGLKICAEGVENRAALDLLAIMGCDRCQGFFISRAVPPVEIASLVTRWNRERPAAFTNLPRAVVGACNKGRCTQTKTACWSWTTTSTSDRFSARSPRISASKSKF